MIRVAYQANGYAYGVILSIDGGGGVTLHMPLDGNVASSLDSGGTVLLDFAYELDDAPLWERFYFVTGSAPFAVAPLLQAATELAAAPPSKAEAAELDVPDGLDTSVISLMKGER